MVVNMYVADELANKVRCLTKALEQARTIIQMLEDQNNSLKEALYHLDPTISSNYENLVTTHSLY